MTRYAAFLRGVSPANLSMPELARVLARCGMANARTLLSSGNATFDARLLKRATLEGRIERALQASLGRTFTTFVRASSDLAGILAHTGHAHPPNTKRVVVFHRQPDAMPALPVVRKSWGLLHASGTEAYGYYTPGQDSASLMALLQRRFGTAFTTRTVDTVRKCSAT